LPYKNRAFRSSPLRGPVSQKTLGATSGQPRTRFRRAGRRRARAWHRRNHHLARHDRCRTFAGAGRRGRPLVPTARTADQPAGGDPGAFRGKPGRPPQTFREPA